MQINGINPISLQAQMNGSTLEVTYQGRAFTELDDVFPSGTTVQFVTATIDDFVTATGGEYAVFAYTLSGTTVVPWVKIGGVNTSPAIPMPSSGGYNELDFVVVAIAVDQSQTLVWIDPKIRITRQAGEDAPR